MRAFDVRPVLSKPASRQPASAVWRLPAALALWAATSFAGAGGAFWLHLRREALGGSHAFAGILLALLAAVQCWLAWRLWPAARDPLPIRQDAGLCWNSRAGGDPHWLSFLGWLRASFVGVAACYSLVLFVGPQRGGSLLFIAGAMSWGTLLTLPLAAHPHSIDRLRRLLRRPGPRRVGKTAYLCCLALVGLEGSLRVCGLVWGPQFLEPQRPIQVTYLHPNDFAAEPSKEAARGSLRVAVMGDYQMIGVDEPRITGDEGHTAGVEGSVAGVLGEQPTPLSLIESALPGIEVVNIVAPRAQLGDYARSGMQQALAARADLLLVFVSVGEDIAAESKRGDLFDWRSLSTSRVLSRLTGWASSDPSDEVASTGESLRNSSGRWEDYVQACAPQLAACRKPMDASMQQRWKSTFAYFDELEQGCRQANIPLALVVAPSPVQTNRALLEAVCRRQGCTRADVDLELPQRRLAVYASGRNLPALDLLPALKQSPDQAFVHQGRQWTDAGRATVARALDGWLRSTFATVLMPVRAPVAAAWNPGDEDRLVAH